MNGGDQQSVFSQLRGAVLASFDLLAAAQGSSCTAGKDSITQANNFIEQVERLQDQQGLFSGWQYFVQLCVQETERPEVCFVCLQRLSHQVPKYTPSCREQVRIALLQWFLQINPDSLGHIFPKFVKNKFALLFALLLQADYPASWPSAFEDLLKLLGRGVSGADIYLRILQSIDEEIFEKDTQYWTDKTAQELQNNSKIKDALRVSPSLLDIANVWYQVLSTCSNQGNSEISLAELCLKIIEKWSRWVDLSLVANDKFMPILYNLVETNDTLRDNACDCLHELLDRGMAEPRDKLAFIEGLNMIPFLQRKIGFSKDERSNDKMETVARVVDTCCQELLECRETIWEKAKISGNEQELAQLALDLQNCEQMLTQFLPLYWAYWLHPMYTVTNELQESLALWLKIMQREVHGYYLQQNGKLLTNFFLAQYVENLYAGLLNSMQYPESYTHDPDDEDDQQFDAHHFDISKAEVNLARIAKDQVKPLLIRSISEYIVSPLSTGLVPVQSLPAGPAQATLHMFFNYAEGANAAATKKGGGNHEEDIQQALVAIHKCSIGMHPDQGVLLTYYDLTLRMAKPVLEKNLDLLQVVLQCLLGEQGVRHSNAVVRSRACYHLKRLAKVLRGSIANFFQDILQAVYPLLVTPIPNPYGNNMPQFSPINGTGRTGGSPIVLKKNNRLSLYDMCGMLVSHLPQDEDCVTYSKILFAPLHQVILNGMDGLSQELAARGWPNCDADVAGDYFADVIQAAGAATKTFPPTVPYEIKVLLQQALEASMQIFLNFPDHAQIRSQLIFFFHRMVACLDRDLIPYIPSILAPLLERITSDNAMESIELVNQLMVKYSIHMGVVIPDLVLPIVQNIMSIMPNVQPRSSASEPPTDDQQSKEMLHRVFTLFMMNIVKNKLHPFLWHDKIVPHLMDILGAMIQASVEVPNATVGKSCFYILQNLLNLWVPCAGSPRSKSRTEEVHLTQDQQMAFLNFAVTHAVPKTLECMTLIGFNEEDSSAAYSMYVEISIFYISLIRRCGQQFLDYLQSLLRSPSMNCLPNLISSLAETIVGGEMKSVRKCLVAIVKQHGSGS